MPVSKKIVLLSVPVICIVSYLLITYFHQQTVFAQTNTCTLQNTNPRVQKGLISTPEITDNKFGVDAYGACAIDNKTAFAPYKIPTYEDLKSIYFTQSKKTKSSASQGTLISSLNQGKETIFIGGDLEINSDINIPNNKTAIIFIDGNLNFKKDFTYSNINNGIVFAVKGNVNVDLTVEQIDAVIISSGKIYTAGDNCSSSVQTSSPLVIEGSLISIYKDHEQADFCALNPASPNCPDIKFCRTLANNSNPAEIVNWQPKYLVILRDIFADTLEKWSEIEE